MFQPRHYLLLQQPQRIVPGFGLVFVVEAEHQERAEAADLAVDLFDSVGDGRGRADDPVALRAILDGDVAMSPVDSFHASSSVSATNTSRTSRQSWRLGLRPVLAAPISTDSQWLPT